MCKTNNNLILPPEILLIIFENINGCELLKNISNVCKEWNEIISNQLNWKLLVSQRLGFTPIIPSKITIPVKQENYFWRKYFINKIARNKYEAITQFKLKNKKEEEYSFRKEGWNLEDKVIRSLSFQLEHLTFLYVESLFKVENKSYRNLLFKDEKIEKNEIDKLLKENPEKYFWEQPITASNTIKISEKEIVENADDYFAIGESKIGGYPDLPKGFEWPMDSDNMPFTFAGQLNVNQLEYYDLTNKVIPKKGGMIYLFFPQETLVNEYIVFNKKFSQPIIYINEKEIKKMGGLERRKIEMINNDDFKLCLPRKMLISSNLFKEDEDQFSDSFSLFSGYPFEMISMFHKFLIEDNNEYLLVYYLNSVNLRKCNEYLKVFSIHLGLPTLDINRVYLPFLCDRDLRYLKYKEAIIVDRTTESYNIVNEVKDENDLVFLPYNYIIENNLFDEMYGSIFLYKLNEELSEERNEIKKFCEYLKEENWNPLANVVTIHAKKRNRNRWFFSIPMCCFEKGEINKGHVRAFNTW